MKVAAWEWAKGEARLPHSWGWTDTLEIRVSGMLVEMLALRVEMMVGDG